MATAGDININTDNFAASKVPKRKREQDSQMEVETHNNIEGKAPNQGRKTKQKKTDESAEYRKIQIPAHRYSPLRENWREIVCPLVEHLKLNVRYNPKNRSVELKTSPSTPDIGNLQRGADYIKAFMYGFEIADAMALLRLEDLFIDTFEIKDVKTLHGDHLSRTIGRVAGKGGRTKFTIENATKTRIVLADSKIHILGSFQNIQVARRAICNLIVGAVPSKVYGKLKTAASSIAGM